MMVNLLGKCIRKLSTFRDYLGTLKDAMLENLRRVMRF